jgi:hypothetical protein
MWKLKNSIRLQFQTALENLNAVDIKRAWEYIRQKSKTSAKENLSGYESKRLKPWFDE